MSAICLNCGAKLSCGCQKRTASDEKSCCSTCLAGYEMSLKKRTTRSATDPTNVSMTYNRPKG